MNKVLLIICLTILLFLIWWVQKKKKIIAGPIPEQFKIILFENVPFYQQLNDIRKNEFEERLQQFLTQVKITGIKTEVEDIDRVFIAASAVIPIFNFTGWEYVNLKEVLLYPSSFDFDFNQEGSNRSVLGMVGDGPLNNLMILSRKEIRQAFKNETGVTNTAIHEFVHLVDKTDGAIDGVPNFLLEQQYILPWLQLMHHEIKRIQENQSDINPYATTDEAEFFAVVSEYFFERPDLLQQNHPELFDMLVKIFRPADR